MLHKKESLNGTISQLRSLQGSPAESSKFLAQFAKDRAYKRDAFKIIQNQVLPAFRDFQHFLETKYMKNVRKGPGVVSLGNLNGEDYYQACLEFSTTIKNINATELYQFGMKVNTLS